MAQKTSWTGAALTESDINTYLMGEGGGWTSHTPQIDQGATTNIAKTVNHSQYGRWGRMIVWVFDISMTAAGTSGSAVTLTLPVTAASTTAVRGGSGYIYDLSTTTPYHGSWGGYSSDTVVRLRGDWSAAGSWGGTPSLALASGDELNGCIIYQAAT